MTTTDAHGNAVREEGVDRCYCGCKYWENDKCVDCGGTEPEPQYEDPFDTNEEARGER